MKRTFLSKLHTNGVYYIIGALLLLLVVPFYQIFVLVPQGYNDALAAAASNHFGPYLAWITSHSIQFVGYRLLLVIAFALLFTLPFTLFRIIVAQEVLGDVGGEEEEEEAGDEEEDEEVQQEDIFADAWHGKGYAVIAAWSGLFGIILYVLGTLAGTTYLVTTASTYTPQTPVANNVAWLSSAFAITTNTVGGGLLAFACLFFGAVIASKGRRLWPGIWIVFGYMALALAALFSGSAVAVASTPSGGQAALTTVAILCFALWALWFGVMLVSLRPE